jgi:hypothetical protein
VFRPALEPTQPPIQWVLGGPFLGVKRGRGVTLTTHPHLVPRSWMSRSYISSPLCDSIGVLWDWFTFPHVYLRCGHVCSHMRSLLRGRVVNTPASYSGGLRFECRCGDELSMLRFFVGFLSPSGECRDNNLESRVWPLPSISFAIYQSLITFHSSLGSLSYWKSVIELTTSKYERLIVCETLSFLISEVK